MPTVYETYPWLQELGFADIVHDMLVEGITDPSAILTEIRTGRGAGQYAILFPNNVTTEGRLVMQERAYLDRMDDYRTVLRNHGIDPASYSVADLSRWIHPDVNVDPNELEARFTVYNDLRRSGRHVRDAFYVYAGIRMSDDDLYTYVVDPNARSEFDGRYAQQLAAQPLDYETFITRSTEAGLDRVADSLRDLQEQGVAVPNAAAQVANLNPDDARQLVHLLYTGGGEAQAPVLGLDELTAALEYAVIGGAASAQGLTIPDQQRVEEIRAAGVTRTQALQGYGTFASQRALLEGQIQRLNTNRRTFTQSDFEEAVFLADADASDLLARAAAREASFANAQGAPSLSTAGGRLQQTGFRAPFS